MPQRLSLSRDPRRWGTELHSWSGEGSSAGAEGLGCEPVGFQEQQGGERAQGRGGSRGSAGAGAGRTLGPCKAGAVVGLSRGAEEPRGAEKHHRPPSGQERGGGGLPGFSPSSWKFGVAICERGRCRQRGWGADRESQVAVPFAMCVGCQVGSGGKRKFGAQEAWLRVRFCPWKALEHRAG